MAQDREWWSTYLHISPDTVQKLKNRHRTLPQNLLCCKPKPLPTRIFQQLFLTIPRISKAWTPFLASLFTYSAICLRCLDLCLHISAVCLQTKAVCFIFLSRKICLKTHHLLQTAATSYRNLSPTFGHHFNASPWQKRKSSQEIPPFKIIDVKLPLQRGVNCHFVKTKRFEALKPYLERNEIKIRNWIFIPYKNALS